MATTNINRVVLTGNLTRDPELRSTAVGHQRLQPATGVQHAPQGQHQRRVGRQAQLPRRHRLGRPGRELRPLPDQGPARRHRRAPGVARVDHRRRRQAPSGRDRRRDRAVPRRPERRRARTTRHDGRRPRPQRRRQPVLATANAAVPPPGRPPTRGHGQTRSTPCLTHPSTSTPSGRHARPDPAWEEAKRRLWAMTADERRAAMHAGTLSLRLCFHWANHAPHEVPLLNGEFWFIAISTPEVADADRAECHHAPRGSVPRRSPEASAPRCATPNSAGAYCRCTRPTATARAAADSCRLPEARQTPTYPPRCPRRQRPRRDDQLVVDDLA